MHLQDMLNSVAGEEWDSLARRRVRHYGYKFEYKVSFQMAASPLIHA